MDQSVLDALKRWPDVPAVFGWLSLTARGEWRIHPLGDAQLGGPGEGISNPQIIGFISRNYASQPDGAWYFQNGPQRVYVRLDSAPLILQIDPSGSALKTHCGKTIQHVSQWYGDETGQLYASTDCGPARVDDRDLFALTEILSSTDGRSLLECMEPIDDASAQDLPLLIDPQGHYSALLNPAPIDWLSFEQIPVAMGFVSNPSPSTATVATLVVK
jgi:hypothetical protein